MLVAVACWIVRPFVKMLSNVNSNGAGAEEGMVIFATTVEAVVEEAESYTVMTEFATGVVTRIVCKIPGYVARVVVTNVASVKPLNAETP